VVIELSNKVFSIFLEAGVSYFGRSYIQGKKLHGKME
jgi:hypothetical protein